MAETTKMPMELNTFHLLCRKQLSFMSNVMDHFTSYLTSLYVSISNSVTIKGDVPTVT